MADGEGKSLRSNNDWRRGKELMNTSPNSRGVTLRDRCGAAAREGQLSVGLLPRLHLCSAPRGARVRSAAADLRRARAPELAFQVYPPFFGYLLTSCLAHWLFEGAWLQEAAVRTAAACSCRSPGASARPVPAPGTAPLLLSWSSLDLPCGLCPPALLRYRSAAVFRSRGRWRLRCWSPSFC